MRPAYAACARRLLAAALAVFFPLAGAFGAGSPIPQIRPSPSPRPHGDPPMRIVRVMSADPACGANCPEWISAEGAITSGTAGAFARIVNSLGGRRLPVLISSRGGSLRDALEMGALIRSKGLAVAVARTLFSNCPERAAACPDARGQAIVGGATCASACPLVLAGGRERLVGPTPLIGVHQITTVLQESEGAVGLTKTVKLYEQSWVDGTVAKYLVDMGVGDPVMALLRETPAASIHWLSLDEIKASGLANGALDPAQPILVEGANGLNGRAFGETARSDALVAKAADTGAMLSLTYRRGGGALEVSLTEPAGASPGPAGWSVTGGSAPLVLNATASGTFGALLPRGSFCALANAARLVATPAPGGAPAGAALALDAADVRAIRDEACP
jgi:hypothetical protein